MGLQQPRSTILTLEEEALMVACRMPTLLPLDDCLYALQATLPHLTRSALHHCLQRHGISRLPDTEGDKPAQKKFTLYPIGYFHIDLAKVHTEAGKRYRFVAIDRACTFASAERHPEASKTVAAQFLRHLIAAVPYKIHPVLTDHGMQFTNRKHDPYAFLHTFDRVCQESGIDHRLTTTNHPWTDGHVERMNRTRKEATVKNYHEETHDHLKAHLHAFLMASNFAKRLKTLKGLTPYEYMCQCWHKEPERLISNPHHHTLGLNT
jgi:transposase InsO family protein